MEVAALVLGIVGAVTGVAALAWQVITWIKSGAVVRVTATQAFLAYGGSSEQFLNVTARNTGRSPVTVKGWGLQFPDGRTMVFPHPAPWSSPPSHRLEPGAEGSWYTPTAEVARSCAEYRVRQQDMTAFVNLADGRTIIARERGIGMAFEYEEGPGRIGHGPQG